MPSLGTTTYNLTIAALKQFWNTMQDRIGAGKNPWTKVAKQGNADSERREIRADELEVIFKEAKTTVPPLHNLFMVMLYTGLRLGDEACLKWSDVDLARGFVSLVPPKTKRCGEKARVRNPITPPLRAMLESCATSKTRKGLVLPDMAHEYEAGRLGGMITKFFRKCGLATTKRDGGKAHSVLSAHSFRHTFISIAANAGIQLVTVQSVVGHMSPEMTAHYFHANDIDTARHFKALTSTGDKEASPIALDVRGGKGA